MAQAGWEWTQPDHRTPAPACRSQLSEDKRGQPSTDFLRHCCQANTPQSFMHHASFTHWGDSRACTCQELRAEAKESACPGTSGAQEEGSPSHWVSRADGQQGL